MKQTIVVGLILFGVLGLTALAQRSTSPSSRGAESALGAAIHQEEAEGNLESAIASYKKFLAQYKNNRPLAARAQFHLGLAYEKLGSVEAKKAYERVAAEFADQKDIVADASRRLAALNAPLPANPHGRRLVFSGSDLDLGGMSPDGRWIAQVEWMTGDGDLVIHNLANGEIKKLQTGSCGKNSTNCRFADVPILSQDARQVVYTWYDETENNAQGQLRIIAAEPGAKPRTLIHNPEFSLWANGWSRDGKSILVAIRKNDRTWQIGVVSAEDGSLKVIKSLDWRLQGDLSLSPDGRYIAYSAFPTNPKQPPTTRFETAEQHIYVLATDGSKEFEIVKAAAANQSVFWMPDGAHIGFVSNLSGKFDLWSIAVQDGKAAGSLYLLATDMGAARVVGITRSGSFYYTQNKPGVEQVSIAELSNGRSRIVDRFVGVNPTWSPDGKSIAFSRHRGEDWDLVVRSNVTNEERVYAHEGLRPGPPRWFHDSKRVLQDVVLLGSPRTSHALDIADGGFKPVWSSAFYLTAIAALSPDDKTFYFPSREPTTTPSVIVVDRIVAADLTTGKESQAVTIPPTPLNGFSFALSPDGKSFAILTTDSKTRDGHLAVVGVDGKGYREIYTPLRGLNLYDKMAWTKDGRSILIATSDGNINGDYEIMRISLDSRKAEPTGLIVKALSTFDLSPDGSRIAFSTLATGTRNIEFLAIDNLPSLIKDSN